METLDICFNGTRLSLAQRVSRWREAVGDHLVDVDMRAPHGAPAKEAFTGSMSLTLLGKDSIATIEASHQVLVRTPERIRRAERETALLTLVLSGECLISQEGRSSLLKPGDLCVYESVKPYRIDVSAKMTAVVATTDRARLEAALGDLRLYTVAPLSSASPTGSLAACYWRDLSKRLPVLDEVSASRLLRAGLDIVAAGLAAAHGRNTEASRHTALTFRRAKAFILENYHRPKLSGATVAAATGLSLRRLQELFQQDQTTVSDYIRSIRLEAARRQLTDPVSARVPVSKIAENAGFNDPAYFSRAFRRAFGTSPGGARPPKSPAGDDVKKARR